MCNVIDTCMCKRVYALSLIWRLFTKSGSLWVAWTRTYLRHLQSFWDVSDKHAGSWIWSKLLKLRDVVARFICWKIGDGKTNLFWYDDWLNMGKILDIAGESGTRVLGIHCYATVAEAASSGRWNICRFRGYHLWAMIIYLGKIN